MGGGRMGVVLEVSEFTCWVLLFCIICISVVFGSLCLVPLDWVIPRICHLFVGLLV